MKIIQIVVPDRGNWAGFILGLSDEGMLFFLDDTDQFRGSDRIHQWKTVPVLTEIDEDEVISISTKPSVG